MTEAWVEAVEEHREAIVEIANSGGPLSDDMKRLLKEYQKETLKSEDWAQRVVDAVESSE